MNGVGGCVSPPLGVLKGGQQLLCVLIRPTQTPYRIFSDKPTLNLTLHIWPWREGERFVLFLVCMIIKREGGKKKRGGVRGYVLGVKYFFPLFLFLSHHCTLRKMESKIYILLIFGFCRYGSNG